MWECTFRQTPSFWERTELEKVKGSDVLMRAFAEVTRRVPDARLVLIGDGSLQPELERIAAEQGITASVGLMGAMDRTGVRGQLHRVLVFALASSTLGFGLCVLAWWLDGQRVCGGLGCGT